MNAKLTIREVKPLFKETTSSTGSETTHSSALGKLTFPFAARECPACSTPADSSTEQRCLETDFNFCGSINGRKAQSALGYTSINPQLPA